MSTQASGVRLAGYLAPVADEIDAADLPVEGALPTELNGRYLRNGPNPLPGDPPRHWFTGHGMLHGVRLSAGRAEWYRNRWVRTGALAGRPSVRGNGSLDRTAVPANTHVIPHGGRILALVETGFPYEVTAQLDTVGRCDFSGRLTTAMTAHPKCDPMTGDLHFFRYAVADAGGRAAIVKYDTAAGSASRLLVLDATDVTGPPVATVTLPRGVPAGFHGSWIDDPEIGL